jgi:site-specific recombinase XerD
MLKLYRRHLDTCKHKIKGSKYAKCPCPIWVDGMHEGKRSRYSLDTLNWEEASRTLLELTTGTDKKECSVVDAATDYLKDCQRRDLKASGIKKYRELLDQLKVFCAGRAISTVRALDLATVKTFINGWQDSNLVQGKKIERLRTIFRYYLEMGWCDGNPAVVIKKPKVTSPPVRPFTAEQVEAILAAIGEYPTKNTYGHDNRARILAFVLTLRYTGLRMSDVVKLSKIQIAKGRVLLYTTKTGAPIYLPLPKRLLDALKAIESESPYYFWTGKNGMKAPLNTWGFAFKKLLGLAKVKGHPHMYRHTMAIELLEKGITVEQVAAILGNSPAIVYKHYAPWIASRQKALDAAVMSVWDSQ